MACPVDPSRQDVSWFCGLACAARQASCEATLVSAFAAMSARANRRAKPQRTIRQTKSQQRCLAFFPYSYGAWKVFYPAAVLPPSVAAQLRIRHIGFASDRRFADSFWANAAAYLDARFFPATRASDVFQGRQAALYPAVSDGECVVHLSPSIASRI